MGRLYLRNETRLTGTRPRKARTHLRARVNDRDLKSRDPIVMTSATLIARGATIAVLLAVRKVHNRRAFGARGRSDSF